MTTNQIKDISKQNATDQVAEVLYQRLGDRVYAFSVINGEVFYGSITATELQTSTDQDTQTAIREAAVMDYFAAPEFSDSEFTLTAADQDRPFDQEV